jgi:RimJ/RimL family protein N-acetyltransferase
MSHAVLSLLKAAAFCRIARPDLSSDFMPTKSESPVIQLRDVEASDLAFIFEHQRDPVAVAMVAFQSRDQAAFAEHWAKLLADHTNLKKTIVVASAVSADSPAQNQVAGHISSWTSDGKREVGYWLDRAFWGRGIATAALTAFLRLEPIRPLYAGVAKHNAASLRVLQKCGFTIAGVEDHSADGVNIPFVLLTLTTVAS